MIFALNGEKGEVLWEIRAGGVIRSKPIVYKLNGEVYMAIGAGNRSRRNFLPGGGQLFVFKLPRQ